MEMSGKNSAIGSGSSQSRAIGNLYSFGTYAGYESKLRQASLVELSYLDSLKKASTAKPSVEVTQHLQTETPTSPMDF